MQVLIVESREALGALWARHLERRGAKVTLAAGQTQATAALCATSFDVIVLDLVLHDGGALAVADLASYRWPGAQVIFVTDTSFFSDGSIFRHCANARAYVQSDTAPEDLAAMVEHYGQPCKSA